MNIENSLPAIKIKHLKVEYNKKIVLYLSNLIIPQKCLVGIVGPNGAGKSTFFKSILNKISSSHSSSKNKILIFNQEYKEIKKRITYIPQQNELDWDFPISVLDFVLMGTYGKLGWIRRPKLKEKKESLVALKKLELTNLFDSQIGELSGGQKQRLFIARALIQDGDLFLLDEPFQGIDNRSEKIIIRLLQNLKEQGKTVLVIHHDLSKVKKYFDQVLLLNRKTVAWGKTKKVFTSANLIKTYSPV